MGISGDRGWRRLRRAGAGSIVAGVFWLSVAGGCASLGRYLALPEDERRLFEIYSVFMTPAEQRQYLAQSAAAARQAHAEALGAAQRLSALPEGQRAAVLARRLDGGMTADALLMSWGHPSYRLTLGEGDEVWVYWPQFSGHLPPSVGYRVYLRHHRVTQWIQFVLPAPERGG